LKIRLTGILVASFAVLSFGPAAANAQAADTVGSQQKMVQPAVERGRAVTTLSPLRCEPNFWQISGNGVRIRETPGGTALGHANRGERVDIWGRSGVWVRVYFKNRPLYVHPRSGWVHQDYVQYVQPTCW
jgi:hypothetical protein